MLKRRLVFVLLWDSQFFCQSRNFRLQRVGSLQWLMNQYDFPSLATGLDEICIIDVTRGERLSKAFLQDLEVISSRFLIPVGAGGGIRTLQNARSLFLAGADKIILNQVILESPETVTELSDTYGAQSLVASVDVRNHSGVWTVFGRSGTTEVGSLEEVSRNLVLCRTGELLLNNIDRDGTGHGIDLSVLNALSPDLPQQVTLMGGVGTPAHVADALLASGVDAVATANLLNFMDDGMLQARVECARMGLPMTCCLSTSEALGLAEFGPLETSAGS